MSSTHWFSDGVAEVPSKTSQLPIIALPPAGRLKSQTLSDPLICLADEDPCCLSLPNERSKQTDQFISCSSSCDNLSLCASSGEMIGEMGRLTKALSDNPVFGSGSPPIPPRDYIPRAQSPRPMIEQQFHKPEIHPVIQDGQKRSNTHYWLLPDKQKTSSLGLVDSAGRPELYVNLPGTELWAKKYGILNPFVSRKKPAVGGGKEQGQGGQCISGNAVEPSWRAYCTPDAVPLLSDVSSLDSMSVNIPTDEPEELTVDRSAEERTTSMGEIKEMIDKVKSKIDGVTTDESYTALAMHHWNVAMAVEYLKVENLFRLGLATREKCRWMLEANGWNLERAASGLLDLMSGDSSR